MNVWIFKAQANYTLVLGTDIEYFQDHFVAKPLADQWKPPPMRIQNKSRPVRDFVSWMMSAPVISEKKHVVPKHTYFPGIARFSRL